ncbi:hypothetical protein MBLNU457_1895t2 [Dothideomycetes sp. NU457]
MAPMSSTPRRAGRPPGRPRTRVAQDGDSEPPAKRRKFIPGGPGGGGHWSDVEDTPVTHTIKRSAVAGSGGSAIKEADSENEDDALLATPALGPDTSLSPRTVRSRTYSRPRRDQERQERPRTRGRSRTGRAGRPGRPPRSAAATPRPRYSSAAAAVVANQAHDGYKPREERGWEEFHPDLDIEAGLLVFTADEVDGKTKQEPRPSLLRQDTSASRAGEAETGTDQGSQTQAPATQPVTDVPLITPKRRPGRPPRKPESMLSGLGSPPAPKILPLPIHNPKERLNLHKPSYRSIDTFKSYEEDKKTRTEDFVDKSMANVGYQESERFEIPQDILVRHSEGAPDDEMGAALILESEKTGENSNAEHQVGHQIGDVEYDMDEQDERWLEAHNIQRKAEGVDPVKPSIFEITMTQIEREYYALEKRIPKPNPRHATQTRPRSSSAAAVNGEPVPGDEPDSKCAICDDGDCENANAIIFCDGCDLAVHQECYGVPFIPEGQWFCRKCKEIGRGTPTCIFCPNIDGAFKQTTTLRWSHLLCAIWIPEVTIANITFQEPIQDVEKAFHVTCARRARLFLRMKSSPTGGIDPSVLKAFCDRHVPPDWAREHDVDNAIVEAKRYYHRTMRNRQWADSQTAALSMSVQQPGQGVIESLEETAPNEDSSTIVVASSRRKKKESAKTGWKLPSGAPVVPAVVFTAVETSVFARFNIRKKKEFLAEACRYWTLKREARRGAALLKRLQLQLESFSSMEITRRNFAGMGAAGRPRLLRRIEFAGLLQNDMDHLEQIVARVTEREAKKLEDAETLRQLIDTVYFPHSDLLVPVLQKAKKLDEKTDFFASGFADIEDKLSDRCYTSVAAFSAEIGAVLISALAHTNAQLAGEAASDITEMHNQYGGRLTLEQRQAMTAEQKQRQAVAKRIIRAIKEPLEDAMKKEADLKGITYDKTSKPLENIDAQFEDSASRASPTKSTAHSLVNGDVDDRRPSDISAIAGASPGGTNEDVTMTEAPPTQEETIRVASKATSMKRKASAIDTTHIAKDAQPTQAPSPPISSSSQTAADRVSSVSNSSTRSGPASAHTADSFSIGGVPFYMKSFDPIGTTIHDEEAPAQAPVLEAELSDELSDIDDEEFKKLEPNPPSKSTPAVKTPAKRGKGSGKGKSRGGNRRSAARAAVVEEDPPASTNGDNDIEMDDAAPSSEKDYGGTMTVTKKTTAAQRRKSNRAAAKDADTIAVGAQAREEKDGEGNGENKEVEKLRAKRASMDAYNERRREARVAEKEKLRLKG